MVKNGYVTFGSFNNLAKINDQVLDLWAAIMTALPTSVCWCWVGVSVRGILTDYNRNY